jgi:hypothetical protein
VGSTRVIDGVALGADDGVVEGVLVGIWVGTNDGIIEGTAEGLAEGINVGDIEGTDDGELLNSKLCCAIGARDGCSDRQFVCKDASNTFTAVAVSPM